MVTEGKKMKKWKWASVSRWLVGEGQKGAITFKVLVGRKVDQIMIVPGLFFLLLFNNAYLCYDLMICVLLSFTKFIHASLDGSRCKR